MKRVAIFGFDDTVYESTDGDHILLTEEEHNKQQNEIHQLQQTTKELQQTIEAMKKSLRTVCIDTENPIHFR